MVLQSGGFYSQLNKHGIGPGYRGHNLEGLPKSHNIGLANPICNGTTCPSRLALVVLPWPTHRGRLTLVNLTWDNSMLDNSGEGQVNCSEHCLALALNLLKVGVSQSMESQQFTCELWGGNCNLFHGEWARASRLWQDGQGKLAGASQSSKSLGWVFLDPWQGWLVLGSFS